MKIAFQCLVLGLLIFTMSCKKDKDVISTANIHGQVYNLCTDSGLANITVYLKENGNTKAQQVSVANGNFSFNNVQVHSSSNYTYGFYIHSESGIGGVGVGFDGVDVDINKNQINNSFILGVVPHTRDWHLYFPSTVNSSTYNDTFMLVIQQNIYHKNVPNGVYSLTMAVAPCPPPAPVNLIDITSGYSMGWWHSILNKTKNGVHTVKIDSFYIGYGATVTDTIPW